MRSTTLRPQLRSGPSCRPQTAADDAELLEWDMMDQSSATTSYTYLDPPTPSYPAEPVKCIWLPRHGEASVFVDKYIRDITYVHHVIHSASLRKLMDDIYHDLDMRRPLHRGHVALLLSIIASATFLWTTCDNPDLYHSVDDARNQAASWVTATLDMLDYSRRTTNGSIEDVQALIIVSFLVCNMEGTSIRYYNLVSTAITTARQLSLHRIDHVSRRPSADSIEAEVGRRVWWYLAALDWILSRFAGPHEGICTIQPRQMTVNKPRNIRDEDMVDGAPMFGLDLAQPTSMSYFLQRIRLGELCYEVSNNSTADHNNTQQLDAHFEKFLSEFPPFFRLDDGDLAAPDRASKDPAITVQTYILVNMVQARRCKLHLPSLSRSSAEPELARSRQICLDAARQIIAAERRLEKETDIPFALSRFRFGGTLYCLFLAIITLLLDVCLNRVAEPEDSRRTELSQAFQILEQARSQTKMATTLLESLHGLVSKYKVSLPSVSHDVPAHEAAMPLATMPDALGTGTGSNSVDLSSTELPFFDDIWQTFEGGMFLDEIDIDSMFAEMNACI
ncbi:hypothetical protein AYO21_03890 [Fonsecaea monophora]|uniref:Xylanolytic transcriptional activator regulatory domain-containing protein n=1 Tax=Fonsecaea monophora TaxID=254056 RepID=A0A177FCE2_9EURO|nr:hypothetical protein AYO21_03890 [Fonsecaea monophora]OAG41887.1 hypothetical protein AYO21_03890 [Fonsecaea monophora]